MSQAPKSPRARLGTAPVTIRVTPRAGGEAIHGATIRLPTKEAFHMLRTAEEAGESKGAPITRWVFGYDKQFDFAEIVAAEGVEEYSFYANAIRLKNLQKFLHHCRDEKILTPQLLLIALGKIRNVAPHAQKAKMTTNPNYRQLCSILAACSEQPPPQDRRRCAIM